MINTVSLSTDHKYIYLIDKANCSKFRIDKGKGVLISTLRHQVTVVCALDVPKKGIIDRKVLSMENRQWQFFFTPQSESLSIIGTTDIMGNLQEEEDIEEIGSTDIETSLSAEQEFKTKLVSKSVSSNSKAIIGTTDIMGNLKKESSETKSLPKTPKGSIKDLLSGKKTQTNLPSRTAATTKQQAEKPVIVYRVKLEGRIIHVFTRAGKIEVRSLAVNAS